MTSLKWKRSKEKMWLLFHERCPCIRAMVSLFQELIRFKCTLTLLMYCAYIMSEYYYAFNRRGEAELIYSSKSSFFVFSCRKSHRLSLYGD